MILHPDGRLEGTPKELAEYQKEMQLKGGSPVIIEKQVPVYIPQPSTTPYYPPQYPEIWCGSVTYSGPDCIVMN